MRFIIIFMILFIIFSLFDITNKTKQIINQIINKNDNYFTCQKNALKSCQVPTLNDQQCYFSEFYKCPHINGSYQQCTNNYWSYDDICKCQNRTFEMCPCPYKISPKCYQEKMKKCPPLTNEEKHIYYNNCKNPRINIWHGNKYNKMIDNGYILY